MPFLALLSPSLPTLFVMIVHTSNSNQHPQQGTRALSPNPKKYRTPADTNKRVKKKIASPHIS